MLAFSKSRYYNHYPEAALMYNIVIAVKSMTKPDRQATESNHG